VVVGLPWQIVAGSRKFGVVGREAAIAKQLVAAEELATDLAQSGLRIDTVWICDGGVHDLCGEKSELAAKVTAAACQMEGQRAF